MGVKFSYSFWKFKQKHYYYSQRNVQFLFYLINLYIYICFMNSILLVYNCYVNACIHLFPEMYIYSFGIV